MSKEQKRQEELLKLAQQGGSDKDLFLYDKVNSLEDLVEELVSKLGKVEQTSDKFSGEFMTVAGRMATDLLKEAKGEKGDKGDKGEDGKDADEAKIVKQVMSQIRLPEDGKTPSREELLALIKPLIVTPEVDEEKIIDEIIARLPEKETIIREIVKEVTPEETPEQLIEKLRNIKEAVDMDFVKGLPELEKNVRENLARIAQGFDVRIGVSKTELRALEGRVDTLESTGGGSYVELSDKAEQVDAEAGTDNDKWMTPLRVKQAIDEFASATGEANTASNVGTGDGEIYKEKVGVDLRLRKLIGGTNVSISTGTDDVTINASGGGASELSDLSDVNTSTPTNRNVLVADGVDWESRALVEADISDLGTYNNYTHPNHSGDVASVGDGATTIANDVVTNAKLANVATSTIKGRETAGTGDPEDLTAAQVRTILNVEDGATADQTSSDFNLADLGDVTNTAKAENKILKVDAMGNHVYEDDNDTTYTAGDGLTLSGTEFANDDKGSDTYNVDTTASSSTPAPTGNYRQNDYYLTALATDPTFSAPSGTASLGNTLYIEITASGATRDLSWNATYTAGNTHSLPTSLADGATVRCGFKYDGSDWILIALDE